MSASPPVSRVRRRGSGGAPVQALSSQAEAACWQAWRSRQDERARDVLIQAHLPHARMIAAIYYKRRTHEEIGFEDYFQLACIGLMESMHRYDPGHGVLFKTFCARRMHGAILDGLDNLSEKNRQIAVRRKLQAQRPTGLSTDTENAENAVGRLSCASEPRHLEKLFCDLAKAGIGTALGILLEGTGMLENGSERDAHALPTDVGYFMKTELQHLRASVQAAVRRLDGAERCVIQAHYLGDTAFGEIALAMGVTRARICQLHRQALQKLRLAVAGQPGCDSIG